MKLAAALALLVACAGDDAQPAAGTERGACSKGACKAGLVCLSDRCVRPPGADCTAVAEALASLELGNYAPVEQRRPKLAAYRAKCEAALLTKEEGACVIAATTVEQLRACPKPVIFPPYKATAPGEPIKGLPKECSDYLLTLERYARCSGLPADARKSIGDTVATMRENWSVFSEATPMPPAVTAACKQGNDAIHQAMTTFRCD